MRTRLVGVGRTAVTGLVVAVLAGCSSAEPEPATTPPTDPPPAVTGAFQQNRAQLESGEVSVLLSVPDGAAPVTVADLSVRLPGFTPGAPRQQDYTVGGGQTVALPALPGRATCAPLRRGDHLVAVLDVQGRSEPVRVRLTDEDHQLAVVAARECEASRVHALVAATWLPGWTTEGSGADLVSVGTLRLGPVTGRSPVTVAGLGSTPLFDYELEGAPLVLAPGDRVDASVRLRPARCDAHAVAEDKVGFGPLLTVTSGGHDLRGRVWIAQDRRAAPLAALEQRCAAG